VRWVAESFRSLQNHVHVCVCVCVWMSSQASSSKLQDPRPETQDPRPKTKARLGPLIAAVCNIIIRLSGLVSIGRSKTMSTLDEVHCSLLSLRVPVCRDTDDTENMDGHLDLIEMERCGSRDEVDDHASFPV